MFGPFFLNSGWLYWYSAAFTVCAALAGWWCAGFAWRCSRLLRLPARIQATGLVVIDPDTAVRAALYRRSARGRRGSAGVPPLQPALLIVTVSAASAFALAGRHGASLAAVATVIAVLVLLALAFIDLQTGLLPDALTLPLLWLGLALAWSGAAAVSAHDALAGAMLGYGFLYVLFLGFKILRGREGMGYGDFKLAAALGAWAGPLPLAYILLAASVLGTFYALCRCKARGMSASYPFGPCLAAAGIVVLVFSLANQHTGALS